MSSMTGFITRSVSPNRTQYLPGCKAAASLTGIITDRFFRATYSMARIPRLK